ncbi:MULTISPECIES: hypothetical protein [Chryseobacterium]|uniref:DUF3857 domain-containing protein n=1 Tax=Chryseobacterium camelliae TaxID=1265445 RepID=A0ABU0TGW6_9FLAO|nr:MULTISPECIES: hypothetical protein [Chryseobacterium]MDT3405900.1 hypothetical protein [Pseudacidovorax intermedius]MDQ1096296.1 hypothetical protein [Chryseobacterium camelliae]MDQ1100234.1 hypothetical protein [Chryseobacterium sp. SORGH_AS_1048]MDR6087578.1 hypothetical protein [Chryseobacterium sp. SORGH_AS_0909]MDR6131952.1 hypothetical protein [Chryseobacterium sp. SORGH_AS_1175]
MKRGIIIFLTVLGLFLNAQNIKTKHGVIQLDGVPVAKIAHRSNEYTFMDLKETPTYTMEFVDKSVVDSVRDSYIKLTRVYNNDKTLELDYISPSAFSGEEKSAVYTSVKGFKIIDNRGINIKNLDELFKNPPKRKLDTKTKDAYTVRSKIDKLKIEVNNVGEILSNGVPVGYFTNLPVSFGSDDTISEKTFVDLEIYDAKSKYIGKYITTTKQIKTAGGKTFTLYREISGRPSILKFPTYKAIAERLAIMDPNFIKVQEKVIVGEVTKDGVQK